MLTDTIRKALAGPHDPCSRSEIDSATAEIDNRVARIRNLMQPLSDLLQEAEYSGGPFQDGMVKDAREAFTEILRELNTIRSVQIDELFGKASPKG